MFKTIIDVLTSSRFKSFYWSTGIMAVTGFLALIADSLDLFHLSPQVTVVVGLILNQAVKGLNNVSQGKPFGLSAKEESIEA
jgi:hypothetical protein